MFLLARAGSRTKSPDLKTTSSSCLVSRVNKLKKRCQEIYYTGRVQAYSKSWPYQNCTIQHERPPPPPFPIDWNLARIEILQYFLNSFLSWVVATHSPLFQCVNVSTMSWLKRLFSFSNCCKFFQLTLLWCKWIMFIEPFTYNKEIEHLSNPMLEKKFRN